MQGKHSYAYKKNNIIRRLVFVKMFHIYAHVTFRSCKYNITLLLIKIILDDDSCL